ncbi:MAG: acyl carrier protein [Bacilli bacterium]|nr:acyl carrier protein [Bacilli bacterium]
MMKEEIQGKLIEKTAKVLGIDPSTLSGSTNIRTEVDLKSIEMVGIISELEEEYDCYIKYTELMHADTIEQAAEIIAKEVE